MPTEQVPDKHPTSTGQLTGQVEDQRLTSDKSYLQHLERQFQTATGQLTGQVTGQVVVQVLNFSSTPRKGSEIQKHLGLKHRETFVNNYLTPLLASGWVERTLPEKPKSRFQKYQTTAKGIAILEQYPSRLK